MLNCLHLLPIDIPFQVAERRSHGGQYRQLSQSVARGPAGAKKEAMGYRRAGGNAEVASRCVVADRQAAKATGQYPGVSVRSEGPDNVGGSHGSDPS